MVSFDSKCTKALVLQCCSSVLLVHTTSRSKFKTFENLCLRSSAPEQCMHLSKILRSQFPRHVPYEGTAR